MRLPTVYHYFPHDCMEFLFILTDVFIYCSSSSRAGSVMHRSWTPTIMSFTIPMLVLIGWMDCACRHLLVCVHFFSCTVNFELSHSTFTLKKNCRAQWFSTSMVKWISKPTLFILKLFKVFLFHGPKKTYLWIFLVIFKIKSIRLHLWSSQVC